MSALLVPPAVEICRMSGLQGERTVLISSGWVSWVSASGRCRAARSTRPGRVWARPGGVERLVRRLLGASGRVPAV